jgi:hypothetical protein
MRKLAHSIGYIFIFSVTLFSIHACRKTKMAVAIINLPPPTDTLTRNPYYFIDSTGTPMPGIILASPFDLAITAGVDTPGLLLVMNQDGEILQKKVTPGIAFDFNRWNIGGQVRYSYLVNDPKAFHTLGQYQFAGYAVIADSNLNTLQQVTFTPFGEGVFQMGQGLDVHDFILISDNHYITESCIIKNVDNIPSYVPHAANEPVVAPLIEEVENGNVLWSWDASADTSFYRNSVTGNVFTNTDTAQDYVHLNSMAIDPRDNNLIVSMRSQCQIIKINRQTGAVMWRLGGKNSDFKLTSNEIFLFQHHASLTDNNQTLLLFDDGDAKLRAFSRVDEFQLDEVNKMVDDFKTFNIPEPFTAIMGSVQKMGNEYFIGGGSGNYVLEVNYVTGQKIMELKSSLYSTYRAFKY